MFLNNIFINNVCHLTSCNACMIYCCFISQKKCILLNQLLIKLILSFLGPAPLFDQADEANLVNHLKLMASFGYGYSRAEVIDLATNYAVYKGIRDEAHPLSTKWYRNFMSRWPDLKIVKPRSLEIQRAKALSAECLRSYFQELCKVLEKYNLLDKPERIFNVDEKGLSTTQ